MLESRRVVVRCCARWILAGTAVCWSALASALGLGEITLHSALNQPLRADIALVDVGGLEEGELSVSLATADEFNRARVERVFFLNDLKFTPVLRGNRSWIQVTSSKPVNEPFLNFLVQLNQPNGRLLREYTVLIDPPGTPGVVPATEPPVPSHSDSAFPKVQPAVAPAPAPRQALPAPAAAPVPDPLAEQLAASVLQNQQLQATIDQLNLKIQAQDEQIAVEKKQSAELQARLEEIKQAATQPIAPVAVAPTPVVVEETGTNWLLVGSLLLLIASGLLVVWRRRRAQAQAVFGSTADQMSRHEPQLSPAAETPGEAPALQSTHAHPEETPASDVLEAVAVYLTYGRFAEAISLLREAIDREPHRTDLAVQLLEVFGKQGDMAAYDEQEASLRNAGFDGQTLQEIRSRHPKIGAVSPVAVALPVVASIATPPEPEPADEYQLNLDELSMDTQWDLGPMDESPLSESHSSEPPLPEPEIEWEIEPASRALDDSFLDEFRDSPSLELEPLSLEPAEPNSAGKLEQAQTCIDDGDLDSAIKLLNELLKEADEPMKQTARSLLAGIR
ncbi:LPXTG cell wall anchor domain-containing protein [Pseudomonas putida]|uniref:LPXTG cell wall anchor domain-containing protein n=1 Tax=Pseudomonas putida TaxID=303 RepID=A0A2Z4RW02_PSEPU|nr:FimV/HubP family polar landmark protein [Pseudomonas putida]AWY44488.1 LPXTG cell wall anchor domain-containing protein [Pseudomonas putida]